MPETILNVSDLRTYFHVKEGVIKAVDSVSFKLKKGQTLGFVGESGCGKTVTGLSVVRLLDEPPAKIHSGKILFEEHNILELTGKEVRKFRGRLISMIFQEPMTSLNPVMSIGSQIAENLLQHQGLKKKAARNRCIELLHLVGIPSANKRVDEYPHQLSGGMRQRAMIAIALACNPKILIADEPTTALDVTIQAQILDLMKELQKNLGTAIMLISHNLGIIAEMASHVAIMYAGKIVEEADVYTIFKKPQHPYTKGLLQSIPIISQEAERQRLQEIPGVVPDLYALSEGCSFLDRCSEPEKICQSKMPELRSIENNHLVRCWKC
jgi:peptide/nickel transport system ATP-binding protein/oligopeptide transport system ATP-binding protein